MRKFIVSAAAALTIAGGAAAVIPAAAFASVSARGTVTCGDSGNVEGVWISAAGNSGWATLSRASGSAKSVSYSLNVGNQGLYSVVVGCGGSPSRWAVTENGSQRVTTWPFSWSWLCLNGTANLAI